MAVTKQPHNGRQFPREHWRQYNKGSGTLFQDSDDKARVLATPGRNGSWEFDTLDETEQLEVLQKFGAGPYQSMQQPRMGDALGSIETYTTRNLTYLPRDGETLKARVQDLLPVSTPFDPRKQSVAR